MILDNSANYLPSKPSPELKAWRHELICKLISAGVTNPDELVNSATKIYEFIVSPKP